MSGPVRDGAAAPLNRRQARARHRGARGPRWRSPAARTHPAGRGPGGRPRPRPGPQCAHLLRHSRPGRVAVRSAATGARWVFLRTPCRKRAPHCRPFESPPRTARSPWGELSAENTTSKAMTATFAFARRSTSLAWTSRDQGQGWPIFWDRSFVDPDDRDRQRGPPRRGDDAQPVVYPELQFMPGA